MQAQSAPQTEKNAGLIPISDAARLLMVTPQWVGRLQRDGYVPKGPRGKVSLVGVVQGYIKFLKDEDRRSSKSAADSRVRDARAAEIELRIAEKRRELIPADEARAALDFLTGVVNETLSGLPARITRDMTLRRQVEAIVDAAQNEIVAALGSAADAVETGADLPYSSAED